MSVAGIPINVQGHFTVTRNDASQICVQSASNATGQSACYTKLLEGQPANLTNILKAKYSALSFMMVGELLTWLLAYKTRYPMGPPLTPALQQLVMDFIFQQLPYAKVCPLEDNGAAWTVDVLTAAVKTVMPDFSITSDQFNADVKPLIMKYVPKNSSCPPPPSPHGGGGKWLGMPMWFWIVLFVLIVLAAMGMYMKRNM